MTEQRDAYETYVTVRDAVLRMKRREGVGSAAPSAYWAEELSNIEYMIEASSVSGLSPSKRRATAMKK